MLRLAGRRLSSLSSTAPSWRSAASAASLSRNPINGAASDSSSPFFPGQIKPNAVDSHFAFFPRFDFHHRELVDGGCAASGNRTCLCCY